MSATCPECGAANETGRTTCFACKADLRPAARQAQHDLEPAGGPQSRENGSPGRRPVTRRTPEGARILDALRAGFGKYVVLPSGEAADAAVLWVAATHAQPAWEHATRLVITAPEKRCGKSRLLDVIEATVHAPLITVNISPAALVRSIDNKKPPTLLLDEADTVFGRKAADSHEDLRGIVNSGHQRNRPYIRWDAIGRRPENCPTFAMAALAGIGDLPDTIMDRAVVIRMRRRAPGEQVQPYRTRRDRPGLEAIGRELAGWAESRAGDLRNAAPELPVEDRAADNWEPLVAIAEAAGGDWPERARRAARRLCAADADADNEGSLGRRLLADVRDIFGRETVSFLPSQVLAAKLREIGDAPWGPLDLSTHKLAFLLRPYEVRPRHNDTKDARGYDAADFADPVRRYLSVQTVQPSGKAADQHKGPDSSGDTPEPGKCPPAAPDTSPESDCPPDCPGVSAAQYESSDSWTVSDSPPPEQWPPGSVGAEAQAANS